MERVSFRGKQGIKFEKIAGSSSSSTHRTVELNKLDETHLGLVLLILQRRAHKDSHVMLILGHKDGICRGQIVDVADLQSRLFENLPLCAGFERLAEFKMAAGKGPGICHTVTMSVVVHMEGLYTDTGLIDHSPAPWLPFRLPSTNFPSALVTKTPTPILGSGCVGAAMSEKDYCNSDSVCFCFSFWGLVVCC